ncbi:hypothetical protein BpHYR1_027753 [Brachionus plicatilis]|uniref:Uncharacterized protein n=1 Tax=Brachionus plicatilis TaxID=10195 RepID=A0A3M7R3C9_BRAPC|nr:hypothetical protein BpHYR1_027753 [Brachionus plicatilis]
MTEYTIAMTNNHFKKLTETLAVDKSNKEKFHIKGNYISIIEQYINPHEQLCVKLKASNARKCFIEIQLINSSRNCTSNVVIQEKILKKFCQTKMGSSHFKRLKKLGISFFLKYDTASYALHHIDVVRLVEENKEGFKSRFIEYPTPLSDEQWSTKISCLQSGEILTDEDIVQIVRNEIQ